MKTILTILGLSIVSFILAACVMAGIVCGPLCFLAGPLVILFGWFYFPLVLLLHIGAWVTIKRFNNWRGIPWIGALFAAVLFAMIGVKENGSEFRFTLAYFIAAFVSGYLSCRWLARYHATRRALP